MQEPQVGCAVRTTGDREKAVRMAWAARDTLRFPLRRAGATRRISGSFARRKQRRDPPCQAAPDTRILAQTVMPAHARYHRRIKPSASSRPTWPSAAHSDRKERNVLFCAAS